MPQLRVQQVLGTGAFLVGDEREGRRDSGPLFLPCRSFEFACRVRCPYKRRPG